MRSTREYPENRIFYEWKSATGQQKDELLVALMGALEKHAKAICWQKIPDHWAEFPSVASEAIWKAIKDSDNFREESKFGTWFHRIVLNCCNDLLKDKQGREVETSLEEMTNEIPVEGDPDRSLLLGELLHGVGGSDLKLAEMKFWGWKDYEIAEKLGTTESTVWNRWQKLKEELGGRI